jgi:hypothetical protein
MPLKRGLDDGSNDEDTEGHMPRVRWLEDGSNGGDEAEGHAAKPNRIDDGSGDAAEGHIYKPGRLDDGSGDEAGVRGRKLP